ncbi:16S rRNA (cytidine(1402)-2'-O)-methyltransferase [Rhodocyclus gracilis]|uniref:16S rRNA (cytidine(1402)-2'-O)-methyltransferase n=1 Tax=Rhodocyclus gracilis TaxID=2929842 RepID=UPI0030F38D5C
MFMTEELPALYLAATPIGNLGDITQRTLDVLRAVPWIAAEDTRHSAPLLARFGAKGKLIACHQHNEEAAAAHLIARLAAGESVAYVSDAGTPAISDPGARLVARVRDAGFRVVPLPGACAAVTAFSAAGFADERFLFYGFLPAKAGQRDDALRALQSTPCALIFYEAPHRILDTVTALANVLGGEREVLLARELTKLFEQLHVCRLDEAHAWLSADADRQRGEFVIAVASARADTAADDAESERVLSLLLADGLPVKQAAKLAHAITGAPKNALYQRALALRQE